MNSLWMMLPAGPCPAPSTTTSGSSRRELTNLEQEVKHDFSGSGSGYLCVQSQRQFKVLNIGINKKTNKETIHKRQFQVCGASKRRAASAD